jgi:WD40 repeat protein
MPSGITRRIKKIVFILFIPLVIIITVLAYFQLFYKSPEVDLGIGKYERTFINHKNIVTAVRFSPDDSLIISGSVDSTIKIWKRESGEIVREIKHPVAISYLDLSNDGNYIVTGSYDSKIRIWKVSDGSMAREFTSHTGTVWAVAFSPDGKKAGRRCISPGIDSKRNLC